MSDLLAYVPRRLIGGRNALDTPWSYADIAQQLASLGISQEFDGPDDMPDQASFRRATGPLVIAATTYDFAFDEEFTDAIGFNPWQVHSTLKSGPDYSSDVPRHFTLFRGGIDLERLPSSWIASGYVEETSTDGVPIWTSGKDGEMSLNHPIKRKVFTELNNLTILGDVVVCASHFALVEETIAAHAAGQAPAVDDSDFNLLVASIPHNSVAGIAVVPANLPTLRFSTTDQSTHVLTQYDDSDRVVGLAPTSIGMILGVTAGLSFQRLRPDETTTPVPTPEVAEGEGLCFVRIATESPEAAAQIGKVVEYRWNTWTPPTGEGPYADRMAITSVSVDDNIAVIDFQARSSPYILDGMVDPSWLSLFLPNPN